MTDEKLNISWEDLRTRRVDNRLREQGAMERNRTYAQMKEDALPEASPPAGSAWDYAIVGMVIFGLIGGLLAWGAQSLVTGPLTPFLSAVTNYHPGLKADRDVRLREIQSIESRRMTGQLDPAQAAAAVQDVKEDGRKNPYFVIAIDDYLSNSQRKAKLMDLEAADRFGAFLMNLISYGLCGMMIAMCLAAAEPLTQYKLRAACLNGSAGAGAGLLGGVAAALLIDTMSTWTGSVTEGQQTWLRQLVTQASAWGTLGLFLGLGSGLVLRNQKKIIVGLIGGLAGGVIGGALFTPVRSFTHDPRFARLVALVAIGVVAGLATGLLENVVKAGWLKVTTGIIAGKQFILYRNPTYIGSSPDCQIYLFKDPQVGKRHAALHLLKSGIELEDLPLGTPTLVNGEPVKRARLKHGDSIQIGATSFRFQEKKPTSGK